MFAALVFIYTIGGGLDQSVNSQKLTASILLRPYIENLSVKHDDITKAIEVFKTGDFVQARQLLDSVCLADASLPPSKLLLATMFQAANRPVLARAELENASRENPTDPGAFLIFA
jgi:Tfp pilus assembly protein PilF